jgi:hypothetical protein
MGHENGGWMNDDQKSAMADAAQRMLKKCESLRRAVQYGIENGKTNMIVDLDCLKVIFAGYIPVGNNELAPEDLTERLYAIKAQRDKLLFAVRSALTSLSQSATYEVPPIVVRDVAERLQQLNQELNLV